MGAPGSMRNLHIYMDLYIQNNLNKPLALAPEEVHCLGTRDSGSKIRAMTSRLASVSQPLEMPFHTTHPMEIQHPCYKQRKAQGTEPGSASASSRTRSNSGLAQQEMLAIVGLAKHKSSECTELATLSQTQPWGRYCNNSIP